MKIVAIRVARFSEEAKTSINNIAKVILS